MLVFQIRRHRSTTLRKETVEEREVDTANSIFQKPFLQESKGKMATEKWAEGLGVQQIVGEEELKKSTADQQAPFLTIFRFYTHPAFL